MDRIGPYHIVLGTHTCIVAKCICCIVSFRIHVSISDSPYRSRDGISCNYDNECTKYLKEDDVILLFSFVFIWTSDSFWELPPLWQSKMFNISVLKVRQPSQQETLCLSWSGESHNRNLDWLMVVVCIERPRRHYLNNHVILQGVTRD